MKLPVNFCDESELRSVFSYLTRIGVSPKFGYIPIHWYQQIQCAAISLLERSGAQAVRTRHGIVEVFKNGRWGKFSTIRELASAAMEERR